MKRKRIFLVCNAHLDPAWLWEWEEGAAESISTFRAAADLCEEFDGFIFNHNEVILYQWVEEYDPVLFKRIQKLVKDKKWNIMGGWFVQPDCNLPSGESFVRHCLIGKKYFREKFGVDVTTAINFDPFGHTRGLVQILAKSGYDSYLFCRPDPSWQTLPANDFIWVGYDGSEIMAHRSTSFYGSEPGKAHEKIAAWIKGNPGFSRNLILWGVGNHGGGPSRLDLKNITELMKNQKDVEITHSTPQEYFKALKKQKNLPRHKGDLNPWAVGCYASIIRIKQKHRLLENEIYSLEKMASVAALQGLIQYPKAEIHAALEDLLFIQFHDILPGSHIQNVEHASLRRLDHGLEIISKVKARAFFALASGQTRAAENTTPVFVYNPHPFPIKTIVECEFQLAGINWSNTFTNVIVHHKGKKLPSQLERELSNISDVDWRKHIVFQAELPPSQMSRFDCSLHVIPRKPGIRIKPKSGSIVFKNDRMRASINTRTGLLDGWKVNGKNILKSGAFQLLVLDDDEDPWRMRSKTYGKCHGSFRLMDRKTGAIFSGVKKPIPSVRVVEDGETRTIVEAVLSCKNSQACIRYKLPKQGTEIEIELRVYWNEKDKVLKLSIPTALRDPRYLGQVAYGVEELKTNGDEMVSQKWVAAVSDKDNLALTLINDGIYGSDFSQNSVRLTLLRSPAYSGHPIGGREHIVMQDRFTPRIDQGERIYRFWMNAGSIRERLNKIDCEALYKNEKPFVLAFYPDGRGERALPGPRLQKGVIQMTAMKKAEDKQGLVLRFFNPTGKLREDILLIPFLSIRKKIRLSGFEIKTFRINLKTKRIMETNLLEK
ncbi:alpha-mannosidase [Candidatus Sumerlaeota bacterium]|nr:alpha-mannosidase [Candidatus Sumerlaeota bacterium]